MTTNTQKGIPNWLITLVVFSIFIALLLLGLFFWEFHGDLSHKLEEWGQFGDYLGGILNPLFSLTALFALLHTIKLQTKELHESTEQLKASAEAFKIQNDVMMRQQFENKFFQMLGLFNNTIETLETNAINNETIKGRNCFIRLGSFMMDKLNDAIPNEKSHLSNEYRDFYKYQAYLLDRYYSSINVVICFVDESNLSEADKQFYCNMVRSQFSGHELAFLFYHCLCMDDEWKELSLLVKKYDMLKYLSDSQITPKHRDLWH